MKKHQIIFFITTFLVVSALIISRLVWLDIIPSGFNWDETAYAYNAYSLMKTGKDEWGTSWPLFLKSFGDYKPAFLSYWLIPWFYTLGTSKVVAKISLLPISLLGLLGVYLISRKSTHNKWKALAITTFVGLSPWHLHYSRALMDPILGFSFFLIGWGLFFQKKKLAQYLGLVFLLLSMYTYNAQRVITPVVWFLLLVYSYFFQKKKFLLNQFIWIVGAVCISALLTFLVFSVANTRASDVFMFSNPKYQNLENETLYRSAITNTLILRRFHLKEFKYVADYMNHYFQHLQPDFLFFGKTLSSRHSIGNSPLIFPIFLPVIILGVISAFHKKSLTIYDFFIYSLLIITPSISALTTDIPHSGRVLLIIFPLMYIAWLGIEMIIQMVKKPLMKNLLVAGIFIYFGLSFITYAHNAYLFFPEDSYISWQGEMKEIAKFVKNNHQKKIYLDLRDNPGIFLAFYNLIDPNIIQDKTNRIENNLISFDMIYFGGLNTSEKACIAIEEGNLLMLDPQRNPIIAKTLTPIGTIYDKNRFHTSQTLYEIYKTGTTSAILSETCHKK